MKNIKITKHLKNNSGTSILELLVVIAVIAIVAAFILPRFDDAFERRAETTIHNYNSNTTKVN